MKEILALPHDFEAEQAVLGAIILKNSLMLDVSSVIDYKSFYIESHGHIFKAMLELSDAGQPIDEIMIGDQLKSVGKLEQVGGYPRLSELADCLPGSATSESVKFYTKLIQQDYLMRDLINTTTDISRRSRSPEANITALLMEAEEKIRAIAEATHGSDVKHIKEILTENFQELEELSANPESIVGIKTGFADLDKLTCGLLPSVLIIIAARPSMGKTALALNIATYAATRDQKPGAVVIYSIETENTKLTKRMLSGEGRINGHFLKTGNLSKKQPDSWDRLAEATEKLSNAEIYFNDKLNDIDLIVHSARSLHRRLPNGIKMLIVDYMQLAKSKEKSTREREVADISSKLNQLKKDLGCVVIALSQLNRGLESRQDKRPNLGDLRDSGTIEQDADLIWFIYRDEVYHEDTEKPGIAEIIIAKHRDGPTGMIELAFKGEYTKFASPSKMENHEHIP